MNLFSVHNTLFNLLDCDVSYIEFIALMFTILYTILVVQANMWNWLMGSISSILFGYIFYQYQLYLDVAIQVILLVANLYGWYKWDQNLNRNKRPATYWASAKEKIWFAIIIIIGILFLSLIPSIIPHLSMHLAKHPVAIPYANSSVAIIELAAVIWQIKKCVNSMVLWMINDAIIIVVYLIKNMPFIALNSFILLVISIFGLSIWPKLRRIKY